MVAELDCRGKRCPLPIIELSKKIKESEVGQEVLLISDDPATAADLNAWARMTGNEFIVISADNFLITKSN
ncbi:MAG: sulfurtransferase TusA family protein [Candidatus Nanopelagicaceae bacterium]|nr:sulfurtransferase TusA family protein [Candidatus Nanopelagicaceae bacterium]